MEIFQTPYLRNLLTKYKTKATMHLEHRSGETMQVDWAGQTAGIVDTDTGELIPAYIFVSVLPYSGYAYVEHFWTKSKKHGSMLT